MHVKDWTEPLTAQEKTDLKADKEERKATLARIADLEQQRAAARLAGKIEGMNAMADAVWAHDDTDSELLMKMDALIRAAKIAELKATTTPALPG